MSDTIQITSFDLEIQRNDQTLRVWVDDDGVRYYALSDLSKCGLYTPGTSGLRAIGAKLVRVREGGKRSVLMAREADLVRAINMYPARARGAKALLRDAIVEARDALTPAEPIGPVFASISEAAIAIGITRKTMRGLVSRGDARTFERQGSSSIPVSLVNTGAGREALAHYHAKVDELAEHEAQRTEDRRELGVDDEPEGVELASISVAEWSDARAELSDLHERVRELEVMARTLDRVGLSKIGTPISLVRSRIEIAEPEHASVGARVIAWAIESFAHRSDAFMVGIDADHNIAKKGDVTISPLPGDGKGMGYVTVEWHGDDLSIWSTVDGMGDTALEGASRSRIERELEELRGELFRVAGIYGKGAEEVGNG